MAEAEKGVYIPSKILCDQQLGSTQKLVLSMMVAEMDDAGVCRLTAAEIGRRLNITRVAAANARLALAQSGHIRPIPRTQCNYQVLKIRRKRREHDA